MHWQPSIPLTIERVMRSPDAIGREFSAAEISPIVRRLNDVDDGYDAMARALCYAAVLLNRPANEIYDESKKVSLLSEPLSCKRT